MLSRIEANNFKSFKHLDYNCARLNLLTGLNGAGKSSFVQLLLIFKMISSKKLERLYGASNEFLGIGYVGKTSEIGVSGKFDDIRYCYAKDGEGVGIRVCCSSRISDKVAIDDLRAASQETGATVVSLDIKPGSGNYIKLVYPMTNKRMNFDNEVAAAADLYNRLQDAHNVILSNFNNLKISDVRIKPLAVHSGGHENCRLVAEGHNAVEYLYNLGHRLYLDSDNPMRHRSTKSSRKSCLIDEVNAWLGEVSPGAKINVERVDIGDSQKFVETIGYGEGDLRRTFTPQNVGFGISFIVPVLLNLLTARPGEIVVIENPEVHLHPRGQSELGRLIACAASSGVQLFVETHSDHLIGGVQIAVKEGLIKPGDVNVAFFERTPHKVEEESTKIFTVVRNITMDSKGLLSDFPDGFLDEWNRQTMELLRP